MGYVSKKKVAAVLEAAAELLERTGWTRKVFRRYPRRPGAGYKYCAVGAIREATNHSLREEKVVTRVLGESLKMDYPEFRAEFASSHVIAWNDRKARDRKMVVRAMRRAAKRVKSGELEVR